MPRDSEYTSWLKAHIALQQDLLKTLHEKDARTIKEGQIALLELELKELRKRKVREL